MTSKDVKINSECCVRRNEDGTYGDTLNLRVGDDGWHKEATNLTAGDAERLREELDAFIESRRRARHGGGR